MGWSPKDGDPIKLNGAFFTLRTILHFVVASAAEAELGAILLNCKEGMNFCLTLENLGHPQPKAPNHCNSATAFRIANNTVKEQQLHSMEMRYFWVCDKVAQDAYHVEWHPRPRKSRGFQSKYHPGVHHTAVCSWYLHTDNSPLVLPRAIRPSTLKGCVGTLPKGYVRNVPQSPTSQVSQVRHTIPDYYELSFVDPTNDSPRSIVKSAAYAFSPAWQAIVINT
jgi:hypothetical protein